MRPRWSKTLSDLRDNKLRTLLVVASIAIGVFSIGMIVSAYVILAEDIDQSYASVSPVNIEIWTDPFYDDFLRTVDRIPGVDIAEGRQITGVRTSIDGLEWQNLTLIAVKDFDTMGINQLSTLTGVQSLNRRELLVSEDFLADSGYQVGDLLQIDLPNGTTHSLPVVGLVADQVTNAGNFTAGPNTYVTMETLGSL
ncbi:MAG: ABC transporter permease, partial [Anaerolineales bacterium]